VRHQLAEAHLCGVRAEVVAFRRHSVGHTDGEFGGRLPVFCQGVLDGALREYGARQRQHKGQIELHLASLSIIFTEISISPFWLLDL
jgi:hypothetical protein